MTIKLGFEVECEVNDAILSRHIPQGGYHNGRRINTYWKSEHDGSLSRYRWHMNGQTYEFVSKKLGLTSYKKAIKSFKKMFEDFTDDENVPELNKIVHFNPSCGCHIHFSDTEVDLRNRIVGYDAELLFQMMMNNMKKAGFSEKFRAQYRKQYYRGYAKHYTDRHERAQTLNFTNGRTNTVEWRSMNLLPVETWEEFEGLLVVAVTTITEFIDRVKKKNFNYSTRVSYKFDKKEVINVETISIER